MHSRSTRRQALVPSVPVVAWVFAAVFFVVGDLVTTAIGLGALGLAEHNPVIAPFVIRHGLGSIVAIKAFVVGVGYMGYRLLPSAHAVGIPLGFAVVGVGATAWNLTVLGVAVLA